MDPDTFFSTGQKTSAVYFRSEGTAWSTGFSEISRFFTYPHENILFIHDSIIKTTNPIDFPVMSRWLSPSEVLLFGCFAPHPLAVPGRPVRSYAWSPVRDNLAASCWWLARSRLQPLGRNDGTPDSQIEELESWNFRGKIIYTILETLFYFFGGCCKWRWLGINHDKTLIEFTYYQGMIFTIHLW